MERKWNRARCVICSHAGICHGTRYSLKEEFDWRIMTKRFNVVVYDGEKPVANRDVKNKIDSDTIPAWKNCRSQE